MNRSLTQFVLALAILLLVCFGATASAQDTGEQGSTGAPPAATGPDTTTGPSENPPLSGLDAPSFEPGFGARSYLLPKLQISESVDTNTSGSLTSNTTINEVTRGLGSLTLQKLWKIHPLDIDYIGGAAWYPGVRTTASSTTTTNKVYQMHSLDAIQRILWRTGQLAIRDSFSYLPTGSFGFNSFGGVGGFTGGTGSLGGNLGGNGGLLGGGGSGAFGSNSFGQTFNQPRIANSSIIDVTQELSPRASVVLAGGYSFSDFLSNANGYVNSQQVTGQVGYNYMLTRKDQVAVSYAFQEFHFPQAGAGTFDAHVWQALYGHRISGKFDLRIGGGPQLIQTHPGVASTKPAASFLSGAGRATLTYYESSRTNIGLNYSHYANMGSGFYAGATSDAVTVTWNHIMSRRWNVMTDSGYSRSSRVLQVSTAPAGSSSTYQYWYAGGGLRYQISRHFGAMANYQYDSIGFNSGFCPAAAPSCSSSYGHHVGLIGLDWTPNPIRLE